MLDGSHKNPICPFSLTLACLHCLSVYKCSDMPSPNSVLALLLHIKYLLLLFCFQIARDKSLRCSCRRVVLATPLTWSLCRHRHTSYRCKTLCSFYWENRGKRDKAGKHQEGSWHGGAGGRKNGEMENQHIRWDGWSGGVEGVLGSQYMFLVQMSSSLESLLSLREYVQAVSEGDCYHPSICLTPFPYKWHITSLP